MQNKAPLQQELSKSYYLLPITGENYKRSSCSFMQDVWLKVAGSVASWTTLKSVDNDTLVVRRGRHDHQYCTREASTGTVEPSPLTYI